MPSRTPTRRAGYFLRLLFLALAVPAVFCENGVSVSGTVRDSQGAAIAGASITLVARDNTVNAAVSSDSSGRYRFESVVRGSYLITAAAPGFESSAARPLTVASETQLALDFQLRIAAVRTQVVVTASGTAQTTDELAKSLSAVEASAIDLSDEASISDALRYEPGLRLEQQGGPGGLVSIKIRGLRNQDTAVLIDGFRMRDAAAPQADATGLLEDLMVTDVDRIEVMRGAGSSLYGTDATGGVVNIITGSGGGRTRGSVLAEGGSLAMFRGRVELAGSFARDRLQYSLGLGHFDVLSGVNGDRPDRISSAQGRMDLGVSPRTRIFGRVFATDSFSKVDSPPEAAGNLPPSGIIDAVPLAAAPMRLYEAGTPISALPFGAATFIPDADNPDSTRAARIFSGAVRLSSHPSESTGLSLSYQGLVSRRRLGDGPAGIGFQPLGNQTLSYDGDIHTLTSRLDWRLDQHNLIDTGYEFEYERYGNRFLMPNPVDNSEVGVNQRSHALFAQDQVSLLGDRLQLAGSYRAQWFSLKQPTLTPSASAPYAGGHFAAPPAAQTGDGSGAYFFRRSGTKIRAHIGRGYRAPSLYERFGTGFSSFGYFAYGDPRLKPEHSISLDSGVDQTLANGRARLSAAYFYTRLDEVIAFDFSGRIDPRTDPFGRAGGYLNTQGGLARGVELSASLAPTRATNLRAAYTYTNARDKTPLVENVIRTLIIPDHEFSVSATERLGQRLTLAFNLLATSNYLAPLTDASFATRPFRFSGKRLAELGGSYRIPLGEFRALRLFGKASNVFNQDYFESGYRTPGATGTGGLQFEF
jgi:iron complex outermembrane receptor protein